MGKVVKKVERSHIPNPGGKGGFGDRPEDIKPGPGRGHKKPKQPGGPGTLADLDQAYTTAETKGEPPGVTAARNLIHSDYPKFAMLYAKACDRFVKENGGMPVGGVTAAATTEVLVGDKEVRVEELALRLLTQWESENATNSS